MLLCATLFICILLSMALSSDSIVDRNMNDNEAKKIYSMRPNDERGVHQANGEDDGNIGTPTATGLRGPYFEPLASKNVTALVGKTAYLNCRVRNLGNKTRCEQ
ncbi:uncharacterized protein LOC110839985 [Zootermopsis nevadensis]|uniref:uncharacterized protein LOC110839985 n=1 Tax=Zootermopsis nevadensis TaxID=136037 RepID=UPI000B8EBF43|nr:uncharacterized protein LOC110839985 [Zootermopsis nevadensis]